MATIALENRKFIGDNKVAIENNTTTNINVNAKAIDELKGQVGKSSTVINDIKNQITNINGKVENILLTLLPMLKKKKKIFKLM